MAYADVPDYEVITGITVPEPERLRIERALTTASTLFALYLGDREPEVVAAFGPLLADLAVARVHRLLSMPVGIRAESVGGSSVTYDNGGSAFALNGDEVRLLAMMLTGGRSANLRSVVMSSRGAITVAAEEVDA